MTERVLPKIFVRPLRDMILDDISSAFYQIGEKYGIDLVIKSFGAAGCHIIPLDVSMMIRGNIDQLDELIYSRDEHIDDLSDLDEPTREFMKKYGWKRRILFMNEHEYEILGFSKTDMYQSIHIRNCETLVEVSISASRMKDFSEFKNK